MRLSALIFLFCAGLSGQPAAFEGTAIHAVTKQPLEGVHVRLVGFSVDGPGDAYGAISDRAGHFSIAALKPGTYLLMPEYRGFVYAQKKRGPLPFDSITMKAGEPVSDFKLEMTPHAVILGRVVDEYGDPLRWVRVQVASASSDAAAGNGSFSGGAGNSTTDDRGKFRLVLAPGKYYVEAVAQRNNRSGTPEVRTDGTAPPDYGATWYPSANAKQQAAVVEVQSGAESSIEIRMARPGPQRLLTISGVVRGIPEGTPSINVDLQPIGSDGRSSQDISVNPDGRFLFSRLEPGTYRLSAMSYGASVVQGPPLSIKLDSDSTNVEVYLTGTGELTGTLEFAGTPAGGAASAEKRTVRLDAQGSFGFGSTLSSEVGRDGTFHIGGIPGGRFTLHVNPLAQNAYISKLVLDGSTVTGDVLDFSHGLRNSKIKVTVNPDGAQISGALLDKDGNKLSASLAVVLLVDDPTRLELDGLFEHTGRVGADGTYSFHAVRPGKYRLLAIDFLLSPNGDKLETVKKLAAAADEFEIKAGDRIAKDIKVIAQEDADAKPKQ